MTDEKTQVREALVEAIAAQKLIEQKISKAKEDLDRLKRLADSDHEKDPQLETRTRKQQEFIAELETDRLAQNDLEKQLRQTLFRLEHTVVVAATPSLPDLDAPFQTIARLEGKVLQQEALVELTSDDVERRLKADAEASSIEDELNALKQSLKKDDHE